MDSSKTITATSKTLLTSWERALLIVPVLAGLLFGLFLVLLPKVLAAVLQFHADDLYIYQLAGSAILGYGVAFSVGLFQKQWLAVRLPVIGVLVFNLASLYACGIEMFQGPSPYSVYLILGVSVLSVAISGFLLARHAGVPRLEPDLAMPAVRGLLVISAIAAGVFGLLPLFVPDLFTIFHLHVVTDRLIIREAGAASLGYSVMAILAQQALNRQEIFLAGLMAAIFNGVGGVVSIPYIFTGEVFLLPWLIGPVGLLVLLACLLLLWKAMPQTAR